MSRPARAPAPVGPTARASVGDRKAVNIVGRSEASSSSWTETTLGELAQYVTSGSRDWSKYYADSGALFIRTQDIALNRLCLDNVPRVALPEKVEGKRTRVKRGDLLITITGNVGRVAVVNTEIPEAYVSQSVCLVRLADPSLADFLRHHLLMRTGGKTMLEAMAYGLGRAVLNLDNIRSVPIRLAPPVARRVIVAEIEKQFSRLDEAVANLKRVKANLKRYKAAVLNAAVEGGLVFTEAELSHREGRTYETGAQLLQRILERRRSQWKGRGKYKEPAGPQSSNIPALPDGWAWATVEQLTTLVTSGSRGWADFYAEEGVLFIRAQDIKTDALVLADVARVKIPVSVEGTRSLVEGNDILLTITGANVTKAALVPVLSETAFVSQHVALLKPVLPRTALFIFKWIVSPAYGRRMLQSWAYGAGKPGLSLEQVRALPVPLPPAVEQSRIVAESDRGLSLVCALEAETTSALARTSAVREAVLRTGFAS